MCQDPTHKSSLARRTFLHLAALASAAVALGEGSAGAQDPKGGDKKPDAASPRVAKADTFILLWLNGGPSHVDTFDPKPKGQPFYKAIKTAQPGVELVEHLPKLAAEAKRLTILRSLTSKEGNHDRARHYVRTSYSPSPTVRHPAFGAWVDAERGTAGSSLPASVTLGGPGGDPGILGASHAPLFVRRAGDAPDGSRSPVAVTDERDARRRGLLSFMEDQAAARENDPVAVSRAAIAADALRLSRSKELDAFDLSGEPAAAKTEYGDTPFGKGCLVARRLVERKVPFIEVMLDGWDVHDDAADRQKVLLPQLDAGMSALVKDLAARGVLDRTLILCMGEFGRSPQIRGGKEGRDHHPKAFSALMAGGGSRPGLYGATDDMGEQVVKDALSVPDLLATCATLMGFDPAKTRSSALGRPIAMTDKGKPVAALMA